ncbi:unnamed protein product [Cuscuta epithymum]|uniref:KIB1-4 beta-propeller domain-containing protein n=1 Tax=Cuscuta epithymum TaxID=186058 RepID=A0AAV0FXY4_9ASTE|nr:unnamed protein product [Cuscuta epithymum]
MRNSGLIGKKASAACGSGKKDEEEERACWGDLNEELLCCILSRLDVMGDEASFECVCKSWKLAAARMPAFASHHDPPPPPPSDSLFSVPHLMYLDPKTGRFNFQDPTRRGATTYSVHIPQLLGEDVHCYYASCGWMLLRQGPNSYFLFNPSTGGRVDLPPVSVHDMGTISFEVMCFSGSPTSPSCRIVGFVSWEPEQVAYIGTTMVGAGSWSVFADTINYGPGGFEVSSKCPPIACDGNFYVLGESGNLGRLCFRPNMVWSDAFGKPARQLFQTFKHQFLLESDGDIMCVATLEDTSGEVCVLKLDPHTHVWQTVDDLQGKVFYVSHYASFSRKAVHRATANKIFFPRSHHNRGLFYYLATKEWRNFPHSFSSPSYHYTKPLLRSAWIQHPALPP